MNFVQKLIKIQYIFKVLQEWSKYSNESKTVAYMKFKIKNKLRFLFSFCSEVFVLCLDIEI
jgi:hypothetical protein